MARAAVEHGGAVCGIGMISLGDLLLEEHDSDEMMLLKLRRLLENDKSLFPIYGDMFSYSAFFQEVLSFARECVLYGITAGDLPVHDSREQELCRIMERALSLDLAEKKNIAALYRRLEEITHMEGLTLVPGFIDDIYHFRIIDKLREKLDVMPMEKVHPEKFFRTADDPRRELEAIVQNMLNEGDSCAIVLADPASQMPVLQGILKRYGVPYSIASASSPSKVNAIYAALVKLAVYQDAEHLLDAMRLNAFKYAISGSTLAFAVETLTGITPCGNIAEIFSGNEQFCGQTKGISFMENALNNWFAYNKSDLVRLFSSEDPWDILENSFEVLRRSPLMKEREHLKAGMAIRSLLMEVREEIHTREDVLFLMQTLGEKNIPSRSLDSLFCTVTDLHHPIDVADVVYIAGCSGSAYPGFCSRSGIFDEQYVASVAGYPSMNERFQLYSEQIGWLERSARKKIYWSFPGKDLQGREIQAAYELETMFPKEALAVWPLAVLRPSIKKPHRLDPATADALYLDNGKITGSVSTIERWFQCPYSWFLQAGLKVRKELPVDSDAAGIGTIQHAIMEMAVNTLHKDYASIDEDIVRKMISTCFDVLRAAHPHKKDLLDLSEERMFRSICKSLAYLCEFEKHTSYQPSYTEHKFLSPITEHVDLRGTIDRVDTFSDSFRIIDYKSSEHLLSPTDIAAGLQLQLLSYLMIAAELFDLTPTGAYYFSLKEPSLAIDAAKTAGRGKKKEIVRNELSEEEIHASIKKERQLKGWTFTDQTTSLDDDAEHIASLGKPHDFNDVSDQIRVLYNTFYEGIAAGNIDLAPLENACTFCDYKTVCRFRGEYRKKPKIVDMKGI